MIYICIYMLCVHIGYAIYTFMCSIYVYTILYEIENIFVRIGLLHLLQWHQVSDTGHMGLLFTA